MLLDGANCIHGSGREGIKVCVIVKRCSLRGQRGVIYRALAVESLSICAPTGFQEYLAMNEPMTIASDLQYGVALIGWRASHARLQPPLRRLWFARMSGHRRLFFGGWISVYGIDKTGRNPKDCVAVPVLHLLLWFSISYLKA
jgi:hypothetical protein